MTSWKTPYVRQFFCPMHSNAHHLAKLRRWFSASPRGRGLRAAPASPGMAGLLRPSHWPGVSSDPAVCRPFENRWVHRMSQLMDGHDPQDFEVSPCVKEGTLAP